jgi:molybdopterin-guanine dinucleotide biosynthesis protein A
MADPAAHAAQLRGLVLAGGRSERLGRDKAALIVDGQSLLERAVTKLSSVVSDVRVAVRPDQLSDLLRGHFALLPDIAEGIGPAAGIIAAHRSCPDAAWLVLACDMPRVTADMLGILVRHRDASRPATAFRMPADGLPEPLCAIYEPATLARFRRQIETGGNPSPRSWLIAEQPVLLDAPGADALGSINTPDDLARLIRP